jgi:ribose 5-phosphate isomerase A
MASESIPSPKNLEELAKRAVGYRAVDAFARAGECIGLGTGSTAFYAIERAGALVRAGTPLRAVVTSSETERLCRDQGVPVVEFLSEPIAVAIDGADEVGPGWSLIKGGGGALFREKAVALAAAAFVVIVTERKIVATLGAFPLPVEVVPYSLRYVTRKIEALGARVTLRERGGEPYVSDNGNVILDCAFGTIDAPAALERSLRDIHGVVASGLFIGLATHVLVAKDDGTVEYLPHP